MIGRELQHYRIVRKLGKGGMGEVFVAEDTKLHREVALKVLPEEMAADPERRLRFEREARAVAALNHPNIVTLHSIEESDGVHFMTMELVDGKTLTDVIPDGGLGLAQLLDIGIDLADALAAAHAEGITHRDLKPDNVMITHDGRLKVLDFGLAKPGGAVFGDSGLSQAATASVTSEGKILGTVAYMSPEQAQAAPVDFRSDLFAFGVVLYQVATGQLPFEGNNSVSTISSILKDEPRTIRELKPSLPAGLARIVRRCLQKDPRHRYQSTVDLGHDLKDIREQIQSGELDAPVAETVTAAEPTRSPLVGILAAVAVLALALAAWGWLRPTATGTGKPGFSTTLQPVTDAEGSEGFPALSPDAKSVVYVARSDAGWKDLMLQRIGGDNPINLTAGAGADHDHPAYSPNGESIAFRSERFGGGIFVMGATGESVRRLTDFGYHPSWSPDGRRIVFSTDAIDNPAVRPGTAEGWVVDLETTETTLLSKQDVSQPTWSPEGSRIAFWGLVPGSGQRDIFTMAADGSDIVAVTDDGPLDWNPVWSGDGGMLYFLSDRGGTFDIWRVPIDPTSGRTRGPLEQVTSGTGGLTNLSAMGSGRLAFVSKDTRVRIARLAFDPAAERVSGPLEPLYETAEQVTLGTLSADETRILTWSRGKEDHIFTLSLENGQRSTLMRDGFRNRVPIWCDDERQVVFLSDRDGSYNLWVVGADGRGLTRLTDLPHTAIPLCGPDDQVYYGISDTDAPGMFRGSLRGGVVEGLEQFITGPKGNALAGWDLSPDGKRIAGEVWAGGATIGLFVARTDSGEYETYDLEHIVPISSAQGKWLGDNRRVAFVFAGELKILDADTGAIRTITGAEIQLGRVLDVYADDRALLVTAARYNDDIWIVDIDQP